MQTNDILERLDNLLDDVDECIQQLPLKPERKKQIASLVYDLWQQVEDDMETTPADFNWCSMSKPAAHTRRLLYAVVYVTLEHCVMKHCT